MNNFSRFSAAFVGALAMFFASSQDASAQSLEVTFESQPTLTVPLTGIVSPISGATLYNGTQIIHETLPDNTQLNHKLTWSFVVPADASYLFNGNLSFELAPNTPAGASRNFTAKLLFLTTQSYSNLYLKGPTSVKISTLGGVWGQINCSEQPTGQYLQSFVTDVNNGEVFAFACPFNMGGVGTVSTSMVLENVAQFQPPVSISNSCGIKVRAKVKGGKATFSMLAAKGVPPCIADINHDGFVDIQDFGPILANWGAMNGPALIFADIDDDGIVGAGDLGIILGSLGACPQ